MISASSWQFPALEQSVWWRGKPSQSRHWFQRWKKASFIQHLCGRMPEPSTAARGVALWTASLAESRASLTALPANEAAKKTNATCGLTLVASSSSLGPGSSSLRTSAACSPQKKASTRARYAFGETYADWVSRLREDCSQRQRSARATNESASSSSQWPTASASFLRPDDPEAFAQRAARMKDLHGSGNGAGMTLATAASAWPTPTANDYKGSGPTLVRQDGKMRGDRLDYAAEQIWSTPRASDGEKGGPNQSFGAGGTPLPAQAAQWMTPRSHEVGQYQYSRGDKTKPVQTLTGQAFTHLDQPTETLGDTSSKERRSLNPLFVEWLMGWPPGWTLLGAGHELTDFASSETALSLWKRHMRCALLQLGLPPEARVEQTSLFG